MNKIHRFIFLQIFLVSSFFSVLFGEPFLPNYNIPQRDFNDYRFPTLRYLGINPRLKVLETLEAQDIRLKQLEFYDNLMNQEERGHIGYHASSHQFRVFQDILRMVYEEVLGLEFKKDFYFFRIPGDPALHDYLSQFDFLKAFPVVNDNLPEQRDQLISVNFTLFSNFKQKYECTPVFFEKAISYKPPNFEDKIALFFDFMGMSHDQIHQLFEIGKIIEHPKAGAMFQIFDLSHHKDPFRNNAYALLGDVCYPCVKKGVPQLAGLFFLPILYGGSYPTEFLDQYRIVVNNREVLNPYSALTIRRYDLNTQAVVKNYEQQLREVIKSIPYDPVQANIYKKQLLQYWNVE